VDYGGPVSVFTERSRRFPQTQLYL
jgi:hypothetical protein